MAYVDGFVVPVPEGRKAEYLRLAEVASQVFRENGALQVVECWQDDVPPGKVTDFFRSVNAEQGERVVFSWILWPSREARDAGQARSMADPRLGFGPGMPFDGKRMIFGGFEVILASGLPLGEGG